VKTNATFTLALAVLLLVVPVTLSSAQTTTSVMATTTTTLPICFPGNPSHQLGVTCQLPMIDCTGPNPHPACGNFPATPMSEGPIGEGSVLVADPILGGDASPAASPTPAAREAPPPGSGAATANVARLSLTG
jgi:hypothetical protein